MEALAPRDVVSLVVNKDYNWALFEVDCAELVCISKENEKIGQLFRQSYMMFMS
jgi:hypothetical protein